jgi:hypothetical protein
MPKVDADALKNPSRILESLKGKITRAGSLGTAAGAGGGTQLYGEIDEHIKSGAYIKL